MIFVRKEGEFYDSEKGPPMEVLWTVISDLSDECGFIGRADPKKIYACLLNNKKFIGKKKEDREEETQDGFKEDVLHCGE
jgi:hypothetical protein